jgi:hypothetical protein
MIRLRGHPLFYKLPHIHFDIIPQQAFKTLLDTIALIFLMAIIDKTLATKNFDCERLFWYVM